MASKYDALFQEVRDLVAAGRSRSEAGQVVAEKHGVTYKRLRDSMSFHQIYQELAGAGTVPGHNGESPGDDAPKLESIVKDAEELLQLVEQAAAHMDNQARWLRAKDEEIQDLRGQLKRAKEGPGARTAPGPISQSCCGAGKASTGSG